MYELTTLWSLERDLVSFWTIWLSSESNSLNLSLSRMVDPYFNSSLSVVEFIDVPYGTYIICVLAKYLGPRWDI